MSSFKRKLLKKRIIAGTLLLTLTSPEITFAAGTSPFSQIYSTDISSSTTSIGHLGSDTYFNENSSVILQNLSCSSYNNYSYNKSNTGSSELNDYISGCLNSGTSHSEIIARLSAMNVNYEKSYQSIAEIPEAVANTNLTITNDSSTGITMEDIKDGSWIEKSGDKIVEIGGQPVTVNEIKNGTANNVKVPVRIGKYVFSMTIKDIMDGKAQRLEEQLFVGLTSADIIASATTQALNEHALYLRPPAKKKKKGGLLGGLGSLVGGIVGVATGAPFLGAAVGGILSGESVGESLVDAAIGTYGGDLVAGVSTAVGGAGTSIGLNSDQANTLTNLTAAFGTAFLANNYSGYAANTTLTQLGKKIGTEGAASLTDGDYAAIISGVLAGSDYAKYDKIISQVVTGNADSLDSTDYAVLAYDIVNDPLYAKALGEVIADDNIDLKTASALAYREVYGAYGSSNIAKIASELITGNELSTNTYQPNIITKTYKESNRQANVDNSIQCISPFMDAEYIGRIKNDNDESESENN